MIIAIIGTDGSGKTTLANELLGKYKNKFKKIKLFEIRYGIFPTLGSLKIFQKKGSLKSIEIKKTENVNYKYLSGMLPPKKFINGLSCILWYSIEYLICKVFYLLKKEESRLHIYARYSFDYLYMRSYKDLPLFLRFVPIFLSKKPDLVFCIKRKPVDIFRDKPELTIDEIEREQKIIDKYFSNMKNFYYLIPNSKDFKTVNMASEIIDKQFFAHKKEII